MKPPRSYPLLVTWLIVDLLHAHGLNAYRVPLSGATRGFKNDIEIRLPNRTLRLESKVRSKGFTQIYKWLEGSDAVVIKADHKPALAVVPMKELMELIEPINQPLGASPPKSTAQPTQIQPSIKAPKPPIHIDPNLLYPACEDVLGVNAGE